MINSFIGQYRFLSNFYPVIIEFDGQYYASVEHAYQAAKTTDKELRKIFTINNQTMSASGAKKIGQMLQLRPGWEQLKIIIMEQLLRQKFNQPCFKEQLLKTNDEELIEGNNWHDNYYGICYCPKCKGTGENNLGKLLLKIRNELKNKE